MRTDKWPLDATPEQKQLMLLTVEKYRLFCRALSIVMLNNWAELQKADSFTVAVEELIHRTARNDSPKHSYFTKNHYKFPSYLRRAAIEFAKGQVSSFLTRYRKWQSGERRFRAEKPPRFNPDAGCYPAMYRRQLLKFDEKFTVASLKLWDGKDRKLAQRIEEKMREAGGRVVYVYARGTSSWAYDGSGKVERSSRQYELATFPNGKRYNADLNASYNIAARFWAYDLGLTRRKDGQLPGGESSPGKPRMPVTLSSLWQTPQQGESEAPLQCAA